MYREKGKPMRRRTRKLLRETFRISGADKVLGSYCVFFVCIALAIWAVEPAIVSLQDAFWYCFAAASTIGFGDISAVSGAGRALTVILSVYSVGVVAIFTAVITSFFMEVAKARSKDSVQEFLYDLEHLPELSPEELKELSEKVKKYHAKVANK